MKPLTGASDVGIASGTLEKKAVEVDVTFLTWTIAVGRTFIPPPWHVEKSRKLINCCSPSAFKTYWPETLDNTSV